MKEITSNVITTTVPSLPNATQLLKRVSDKGSAFVSKMRDPLRRAIAPFRAQYASADAPPSGESRKRVRDHLTSVRVEEPSVETPVIWEAEGDTPEEAPIGTGMARDLLTEATGGDSLSPGANVPQTLHVVEA